MDYISAPKLVLLVPHFSVEYINISFILRDNDILKQIDNDVRRTRPEVEFFQKYTKYPLKVTTKLSQRINYTSLAVEES